MKKQINGNIVSIDTDFFSDYLYGCQLNNITLSNIKSTGVLDKSINSVIEKYEKIYDSLHPIIQKIENIQKYCIIGELMKIPYLVKNNKLYVNLGKSCVCFSGQVWSISKVIPTQGYTFKDMSRYYNYDIYRTYLESGAKSFIKNAFPSFWNACNGSPEKVNLELQNILTFIPIEKMALKPNTFIDVNLKLLYSFQNFMSVRADDKDLVIDLKTNQVSKAAITSNFVIYKQEQIKGGLLGKEVKVDPTKFADVINVLKINAIESTTGIIINNVLYYEVNDSIYQSKNGNSTKLVNGGKIYGHYKENYLLVYTDELKEQNIVKRKIYIIKDNVPDLASLEYFKKEA